MLIPLICTKCGGKLEVQDTQVTSSGGMLVVLPDQTFKCPHCATQFMEGDRARQAGPRATISIGGKFSGVIVTGDNNKVEYSQEKNDSGPASE